MTSYSYPAPSIIEKIIFRKSDNGTPRAYLHAAKSARDDDVISLAQMLSDKGYYAIHSVCDGKSALEVRGYLWEKELLKLLDQHAWIEGKPTIIKDNVAKKTFLQTVQGHSLPFASGMFILADVGYTAYGHKSGRPEDAIAGLSYMAGSATMGLLGTHAQAMSEIKKQTRKLMEYAKDHHLDLSQNLTIPMVTEENKRSVFQNVIDTLQNYPAEIGNSFTSLAGLLIAYSSWKYRVGPNMKIAASAMSHSDKVAHSAGLKDIGLGFTTFMSGMVGAWVKEKKHDPDKPPAQGLEAIWEWVQEKPLRVAGFGYMISTGFHTLSTIQEYKHAKLTGDKQALGAVPWRALFIGSTILAEVLLTMSSKGHGDGVKSDISTDDSVISIAAEMISQQKPDTQAALIQHIGSFLGREDVLGGKDREVTAKLAAQVEAMRHNPWIKATAAIVPPEAAVANNEMASWQSKMAATPSAPPVLGA